jgi:hypothetical protein
MSSDRFYDFWMEYLNGHQLLATRLWHFVGTAVAVMTAVLAIITWNPIYLVTSLMGTMGGYYVGTVNVGARIDGRRREIQMALDA